MLVASLFRNFLLAERIMRSANCSPISHPMLPTTHQHHMWDAWDMAAEICLSQLPGLVEDPNSEFQDDGAEVTSLRMIQEIYVEAENCSSGSKSSEAAISKSCSISSSKTPVSDSTIFKYCLEGLSERSLMLKEIAMATSELELANFAEQVSQYSGCFHHRISAQGLQDPGTFVLRFPTSRSWPHPDVDNLVVTYVRSDYNIHHKLLSLYSIYRICCGGIQVRE
ncbi:hypothetical protein POM88_041253 [Heracleum sosnowskyi]|uniref:SH2 domain-containing protein n=1 Tax=Heracleum sosnowskyi TaxID=360622 RepID=A0AAD8HDV5_9APIA|nr:hypothetical protein POM88_041253 [Heracleum sosnowskyi]